MQEVYESLPNFTFGILMLVLRILTIRSSLKASVSRGSMFPNTRSGCWKVLEKEMTL